MNLPKVSNNTELLVQIDQTLLYEDLVNQLNKDFEIIGTAINFSETENPKDLFEFLQEVISELLEKHFDVFLNLLYRIDINENQIKTIINQLADDTEQQIAFLILKREWQKVWFKKYYS
jgi:regulator of sigma D